MFRLCLVMRVAKSCKSGAFWVKLFILFNLVEHVLVVSGLLPVPFEVIRGAWYSCLVALPCFPFLRIGDRCQEVTSCLPLGAEPAHSLKVRFRIVGRPEINLAAFVEHNGLVENVVDTLTRLVNGYSLRSACHVCGIAKSPNELKSRGGIESSSTEKSA